MNCLKPIVFCLMLSVNFGCTTDRIPEAAKKALLETKSIEFLSLSPEHLDDTDSDEEKAKRFHNWQILGKTSLDAEETRDAVITAFINGVNENDGMVAGCFNPRHGLRLTHDGEVHDFVICFECLQVQWYIDSMKQDGFLITKSPGPTFNKILSDAKVPLPSKK